jgi:hypothetical protein
MADKDDIQKKLDEVDKRFNVADIRKHYKARLIARINKGEIGLLDELKKLEEMEKGEIPGMAAPKPPSPPEEPEEVTEEDWDKTESGLPSKMRIKRNYTMSDAALDQRRTAANSGKQSKSMEGNRNAWKTGEHARGFIRQVFRPCKSTCPKFPCSLLSGEEVEPGNICIDKEEFSRSLQAVESAVSSGNLDDLKGLVSVRIAGGMEILKRMILDILEDGASIKSAKWDKNGGFLGWEIKNHPSLPFLPKMYEVLNVTPQEFLSTPLIIKKTKTEDKKAKTLADIMSGLGGPKEEPPEDSE